MSIYLKQAKIVKQYYTDTSKSTAGAEQDEKNLPGAFNVSASFDRICKT